MGSFFYSWLTGLCLLAHVCFAQPNPYVHLSIAEGLPSAEVYDMHQDQQGYIWFATDNGVVRYDGKKMETFQTNEGLADPVVFEFVEDNRQRLWCRTFSGRLCYFENERFHPYAFNDSLTKICKGWFLESIYPDAQGQLWFGSGIYVGTIDAMGNVKKRSLDTSEIALQQIQKHLIQSSWGWVGKINKVTLEGKTYKIPTSDRYRIHPKICTAIWQGKLHFSIGSFIYTIDDHAIQSVYHGDDQIISLSADREDHLWVGELRNGVIALDKDYQKINTHFDFIQAKSITRILQDRDGGFWIGTLQDGVFYVPDGSFLKRDLPVHSRVNSAIAWGANTIVGDDEGLLLTFDSTGSISRTVNLGFPIINLFCESDKRIWVSNSDGTFIFDSDFHRLRKIPIVMNSISKGADGVIKGVSGPVILHLDTEGNIIARQKTESVDRKIFHSQRYTYLSQRLGIKAFTQKGEKIKLPSALSTNIKTTSISILNDSLVIIGTLGTGFFVLNQNHWTTQQYFSKQRFTSNNIYSVLVSGPDVWFGTDKGLAVTSAASLAMNNPTFTTLLNDKINHLIPTQKKILAFAEDFYYEIPKTFRKTPKPVAYVQKVEINSQETPIKNGMKFSHEQNNIQLNCRFIDFRNQNILIRSKLSEQENWNYSTDRIIKFYSLRPHSYSLFIEYSTDNIHWDKLLWWTFVISPPWWAVWYFQLLFFVTSVLILILYLRRRYARVAERGYLIHSHQEKLLRAELETQEKERNRIAKELHDGVGTSITAIKMSMWTILKKYNDPQIEELERQFRDTIKDIRAIIHDLVPSGLNDNGLAKTLSQYASSIEAGLAIKIDVNSFGPDIKDPAISLPTFRILQELISNTLKHARATRITIDINSFSDFLNIVYQDNGEGFDVATVEKGWGLLNIELRIKAIKGTLNFESSHFGVTYTIDIPLNIFR